jgi:hypothetical protein
MGALLGMLVAGNLPATINGQPAQAQTLPQNQIGVATMSTCPPLNVQQWLDLKALFQKMGITTQNGKESEPPRGARLKCGTTRAWRKPALLRSPYRLLYVLGPQSLQASPYRAFFPDAVLRRLAAPFRRSANVRPGFIALWCEASSSPRKLCFGME